MKQIALALTFSIPPCCSTKSLMNCSLFCKSVFENPFADNCSSKVCQEGSTPTDEKPFSES